MTNDVNQVLIGGNPNTIKMHLTGIDNLNI